MNGIDLFHYTGKAQEGDSLDGFDVNYPDAAGALRVFFRHLDFNGCIGGGSHLRQTDEGKRAREVQPAGETGEPDHRLELAGLEVYGRETAFPRLAQPQPVPVEARRVRHEQSARDRLPALHVDHDAVAFVGAPPLKDVAFTECSNEPRATIL